MCFHRSRYWERKTEEARDERLWDLFYRETERSEPPVPISEQGGAEVLEDERDEVTATER
jgi:hypothetical protein